MERETELSDMSVRKQSQLTQRFTSFLTFMGFNLKAINSDVVLLDRAAL